MKKEVINKISTLVISAFGLVAALAWNGAIQSIFKEIFGSPDGIWSMLTYAIVVTIIAVIITVWLAKIGKKE
jgi:hypothetical protein